MCGYNMSKITNEAKIKNPIIVKVREQLEHRAMWLALLSKEAEAKCIDISEFGRDAIFQCGCLQGKNLSGGSKSFKILKKICSVSPHNGFLK